MTRTSQAPEDARGEEPPSESDRRLRDPQASLRPLLALAPYLTRYKRKLIAGRRRPRRLGAIAMLIVPLAVRRVIDLGFGSKDGLFIDRYFAMLVVVGLVLAVASAARFYYVNWLGERVVADLRSDVFRHVPTLGPGVLRDDALGRADEPPHGRHHADEGGRRLLAVAGAAQPHHAGRRASS